MSNTPIVTEVQTPSSGIAPSVVRTGVPLVVGLIVTWLVQQLGLIELDSATGGAVTTGVAAWLYYTVVRFLEVYASSKWGYILGIGRAPVYSDKAPPVTVEVPSEGRGDAGAASPAYALIALGLVLVVVTLLVGGPSLLWGLGLVCLIVGIVLLFVPMPRR